MVDAVPGLEDEPYAEEAPLGALLGPSARVKLLSVFVAERGRDLSTSDLARQAGLARSTVYEHLEQLQELGVVEHTRDAQGGYSPHYQLDESSDIAVCLHRLEGLSLRRLFELDGTLDE
jgi:predicted ArsR family transcriptional regulator